MTKPHRYSVGDKVVVTPDRLEHMRWHNRQAAHPNYPSMVYLEKVAQVVDIIGEVTHTFPPGYEVTAEFAGRFFHMKDNWLKPSQ